MPETKETFELLKNYIEDLPIGLMLFSKDGVILSWNKYAVSVLECTQDDFKKDYYCHVTNQVNELLHSEIVKEKELIGLSKPLKAKKIITDDKNIILVITEAHQEALGEMSHELRRPITNIKTLTESLLLGAKDDPEIANKFLQQINGEIDRLTKLVGELINLSKIRSGKSSQAKKKLNLKSKVDESIKLIQAIADKHKTKITNEVPNEYEVYADSEQLDHVIQNLLENSIKYSPEGANITIKSGPVTGSFQVDDTGIGIAESEISKIFDRFYRVDRTRAKGSSGLGLSIVKNVVDLHGGKIEVKSKLGSGSSFIIYMPIG